MNPNLSNSVSKYCKILILCEWNIFRSPAVTNIANKIVAGNGVEFYNDRLINFVQKGKYIRGPVIVMSLEMKNVIGNERKDIPLEQVLNLDITTSEVLRYQISEWVKKQYVKLGGTNNNKQPKLHKKIETALSSLGLIT